MSSPIWPSTRAQNLKTFLTLGPDSPVEEKARSSPLLLQLLLLQLLFPSEPESRFFLLCWQKLKLQPLLVSLQGRFLFSVTLVL